MRPWSRRRRAAWLLALPAGSGGERCARRGRLEMISFWLLCWKLVRATTGLRRNVGELTDGNQDHCYPSNSLPVNRCPPPTNSAAPVAMETRASSPPPPPESETQALIVSSEPATEELHFPEGSGAQDINSDEKEVGREGGEEDEDDGEKEGGKEEEENGYRGGGAEEGVQGEGPTSMEEVASELRAPSQLPPSAMLEQSQGQDRGEDPSDSGLHSDSLPSDSLPIDSLPSDGLPSDSLPSDGLPSNSLLSDGLPSESLHSNSLPSDSLPSDGLPSDGLPSDGLPSDSLPKDGLLSDGHPSDGHLSVGPPCGHPLHDGHPSDGGHLGDSNQDDGHLSDSQLSDCLQAELAMVTSSDSETGEDQWESSTLHDITDQIGGVVCSSEREEGEGEEEERGNERSSTQTEGGRMGDMKIERQEEKETEAGTQEQREEVEEEKSGGRRQQAVERMLARDVLLRSPSVSSSASSTDTDRKLPADFCVLQESCSENVFTEHLDFLLARQQWRKMEEEVKGKPLPQPSGRSQGSVQGTHSSLYPPTRSPHIQRRTAPQAPSWETPVSSTLSPSSEDSGLDDPSYRGPSEEPESAVEREIRLTLEREERHRRERGRLAQGLSMSRPVSLQTGRSPPRPPACRTPTLSISPSPASLPLSPSPSSLPLSPTPSSLPFSVCPSSLPRSAYHELTANNVIILEPDSAHSRSRLLSPGGLTDWSLGPDALPSTDVIVVETANLIIRSASEFCLSSIPIATGTQESTFSSNPFFKLRSLSSQSLVEQEIRLVRQREEEWRRQREEEWRKRRGEGGEWRGGREKERFDTVLVSPGLNDNITFNMIEVPDRCVSSPSSPSRTRKLERSSMSCDHKFPPGLSTLPRRQNAMAQRWEANLLANQKKE